jgi:hypothetical protein
VTGAPAEPVPVAFYGRTSTLVMQDPAASLNRQLRGVKEKLPPGWFIAASFWDIESGGMDLEARGHASTHQQVDTGIPRDGGMATLLTEAGGPAPRFAAVICEDIERSARDTFSALKLEKELTAAGVPLFATDEPISIEGMNATTVLIRRVKQGVAEWFRLQLKEKAWKGLREHTLAGWNIGPAPYGYHAERVPHPVAFKAAQGRTKSRLILNPAQAPPVAALYHWRTEDRLGVSTITDRLNADHASYPPPDPAVGWTASGVASILANPKYTGHMVFGRRRSHAGKLRLTPQSEWLWSPQPTHPAIISRAVWDAAQQAGAEHGTSRDDLGMASHPHARRTYVLRSRIRCKACRRRMSGITRTSSRYYSGQPDAEYTYYVCPHNPRKARHQAANPDHPRAVSLREDVLMPKVAEFFATWIFGPERRALLAATLPATPADQQAQRDKEAAALRTRLRQIDTAENAHAREIEHLASEDPTSKAVTALRSRILARFSELEAERGQIDQQLAGLAKDAPPPPSLDLLDNLPVLGDILSEAPPRLQMQLFTHSTCKWSTRNRTTGSRSAPPSPPAPPGHWPNSSTTARRRTRH